MMMDMYMNKVMSNEELNTLVAKAVSKGIEFTKGDFTRIDGKTVAVGEFCIQQNFLREMGFKEMR